jgi:dTDP-4-amino-4,6-dideoxygalactose transaminase
VLESGHLAAGEQVEAFEAEFASYCDTAHAVATTNGTTALHLTLHALGIGSGDTVLTTPFSFVATANAVRLCGAKPVFADVDPWTLNLDPDRAEAVVREHDVDAIVVVHLYGLPADMDRFVEIAERHDLLLVEDAAQAHGATFDGRPVGSIGDVGCFSFYPTKNMTTGEGGMITTDRESVAERARQFRNHGRSRGSTTYDHVSVGHNFRMTDLTAAIGRAQLERLPEFVRSRRENAATLTNALCATSLLLPPNPSDRTHVYHQYTVRTGLRDRLRTVLDDAGIDTGIYYPRPIHRQPAYRGYDGVYPDAEVAPDHVLSLPVHPGLTDDDLDRIVTETWKVVANG